MRLEVALRVYKDLTAFPFKNDKVSKKQVDKIICENLGTLESCRCWLKDVESRMSEELKEYLWDEYRIDVTV